MAEYQIQFRIIRTNTTVYWATIEADQPPTPSDIQHLDRPVVQIIQESTDAEYRVDWTITERVERADEPPPAQAPEP